MKYMPEFRFRLDTSFDNFAQDRRAAALAGSGARSCRTPDEDEGRMSRRGKKKGRPVSGWLVLDKPVGMGSTEAVSKVKWLFQADKAGHAGTLDPLASGMLPIALGEATKTVPYVMDGAKIYRFTVAWGEERSTDDLEGAGHARLPTSGPTRQRHPRAAAEIYRRHHADAAAVLGHQDRRRARL